MNTSDVDFLNDSFDYLFPICRSITGPGLERSLEYLGNLIPLKTETIPTYSKVFDWEVPQEWHFDSAQVIDFEGNVVIDTKESNLHIVNYSEPVDRIVDFDELMRRTYTLPELPDAIPYVTSYYKKTWGFCITDNKKREMFRKYKKDSKFKVNIKSKFVDGGVPFAHSYLPATISNDKEILLTSYLCHPSLANNELSGPLALVLLYKRISAWKSRKFNYRFLLNPETIGSLCFLSKYHEHLAKNLESGMILTCVGGPRNKLRFKHSKRNDSNLDKLVDSLICHSENISSIQFSPLCGSDERQYCSPGFNLPMLQVARTVYGEYEGYHNSLDNKEFMNIEQVIKTVDEIVEILYIHEKIGFVHNLSPFGEPQLGKRGLYPNTNNHGQVGSSNDHLMDDRYKLNIILNVLSLGDGTLNQIDIANRINIPVKDVVEVVDELVSNGIVEVC